MNNYSRYAAIFGGAIILLLLYWNGAQRQLSVLNGDYIRHDQHAVMNYAERIVTHHYHYDGPRNRMPLYPYLQSLFYRQPMGDGSFFLVGDRVNIGLSVLVLILGFVLFYRRVSFHPAANALLIAAFTVFIFKAPYFQPEILYYGLSFMAFLLMWRMLSRPGWGVAILCGFVLALGHLTKASILPGLGVFLICYLAKAGCGLGGKAGFEQRIEALMKAGLLLLVFIGVLYPYLRTSKRVYGGWFYNVNSTFYMWCDSWDEAKSFSEKYDDRHGLPDIAPAAMPGPAKYLREHSAGRIFQRIWHGFWRELTACAHSYGYFKYFVLYLAAIGFCVFKAPGRFRELLRDHRFLAAFLLLYFSGYFLLYAWYMPIARGQRFVLALFLPLLYTLVVLFDTMARGVRVKLRGREFPFPCIVNWAVSALCVFDICFVLSYEIVRMSGGN